MENRKAKFIIHDINSKKIYVKYYQKTDEMSIKNIKDSLNNVSNDISSNSTTISTNASNISSNLEKINNISDIKIEKGEDHYIVKNIHIIDLKNDKDITINQNEFIIHQTEINSTFKKDDYLQLNETIYYLFENVKLSLHLIKEHYIFKNENDEIIYDFEYNVSSRGSVINNSYIFKNKKFVKIEKDISKLKMQLFLKKVMKQTNLLLI